MFSDFSLMVLIFFPQAKDLIITPATVLKEKPDPNTLVFGTVFTDHMLTVEWSSEFGWEKPHIKPLQNLSMHPGTSAFHYAVEVSTWELTMPMCLVFTVGTKELPMLQQVLGAGRFIIFTQGSHKCL